MPSKKNRKKSGGKISKFLSKLIFVMIVLGLLGAAVFWGLSSLFNHNSNFRLKYIRLGMPDELKPKFSKFNSRIGDPIFNVDLKEMADYSWSKYPYLEYIRAVRILPNCIEIEAKPRLPIARTPEGWLLDREGVLFPNDFDKDYSFLPKVSGVAKGKPELGKHFSSAELNLTFLLLEKIPESDVVKSSDIESIYVGNASDASFNIKDGPQVRIGDKDLDKRLFVLAKIIFDAQQELKNIKYIDLRFKDPVIGYK